ncbi:hypothetical protein KSP40_PGU003344 [Platanthera guangdongensis]|uniref:Uncharacterized protein n=1 Tax=Platanthera guangdongensis TaxID=2320717 RepID=A0ABR2MYZ3_9ASPA
MLSSVYSSIYRASNLYHELCRDDVADHDKYSKHFGSIFVFFLNHSDTMDFLWINDFCPSLYDMLYISVQMREKLESSGQALGLCVLNWESTLFICHGRTLSTASSYSHLNYYSCQSISYVFP